MTQERFPVDRRKREFVTRAAYVVPAVVTFAAAPSFASAGSGSGRRFASRHETPTSRSPQTAPGANARYGPGSPVADHRSGEEGATPRRDAEGKTSKTGRTESEVAPVVRRAETRLQGDLPRTLER